MRARSCVAAKRARHAYSAGVRRSLGIDGHAGVRGGLVQVGHGHDRGTDGRDLGHSLLLARELFDALAVEVPSMVLVVVGDLVEQQHGAFHSLGHCERYLTLFLRLAQQVVTHRSFLYVDAVHVQDQTDNDADRPDQDECAHEG